MGFGDFGANQNQHSVSWEGPRVFFFYLPSNQNHSLAVLWMLLLAMEKDTEVRQRKMK